MCICAKLLLSEKSSSQRNEPNNKPNDKHAWKSFLHQSQSIIFMCYTGIYAYRLSYMTHSEATKKSHDTAIRFEIVNKCDRWTSATDRQTELQ